MIVEEIDSVSVDNISGDGVGFLRGFDYGHGSGNGHGNSDGYGFGSEEADDYLPF